MTCPIFMLGFLIVELAVGGYLAARFFGPWLQKLLGFIWTDPTIAQQPEIIKRMKELCIDSGVSVEAARMVVAKERNITEEYILDAMQGIDMCTLKAALGGSKMGMVGILFGKFGRSVSGFKGGLR